MFNFFVIQFSAVLFYALIVRLGMALVQHSVHVNKIFTLSAPFKILKPVISWISIFVINKWAIIVRLAKGKHDEPSYIKCPSIGSGWSKINFKVASTRWVRLENSVVGPQMAHYAAKITDAVTAFKTRDCFPDFSFDNWFRHLRPFCSRLFTVQAYASAITGAHADFVL